MRKMRLGKKGFTLVEMLVVVVIIGVLVAIALPRFWAATEQAKIEACKSNQRAITTACELYHSIEGEYPSDISDLENVTVPVPGGGTAVENLLQNVPDNCPVDNATPYTLVGNGSECTPCPQGHSND
jgi:type II secretion system protein G